MPEMLDESRHMESTTLGVYRTAATVKGGRRFSFGALVVVGNRNGQVGFGYAKGSEVPNAVEKAQKYAQRALVGVSRVGTTIHHEVEGQYASSKVRLIPASPGTGVVAGGVVRAALELAGVSDCLTKCFGSTNPVNIIKATFAGLARLRTPEQIAHARGVQLERTEIEHKIERGKAFMPTVKTERARGPVNTVGQDRGGRGGRGGGRGGRGGRGGHDSGGPASSPASEPAAPAPPQAGEAPAPAAG